MKNINIHKRHIYYRTRLFTIAATIFVCQWSWISVIQLVSAISISYYFLLKFDLLCNNLDRLSLYLISASFIANFSLWYSCICSHVTSSSLIFVTLGLFFLLALCCPIGHERNFKVLISILIRHIFFAIFFAICGF